MDIKKFLLRWLIFLSTPKDFLYSFTYSSTKKIVHAPFDPQAKKTALKLAKQVEKSCPGVSAHLFGSLGFEIPGQNDIDIYFVAAPRLLDKSRKTVNRLLGLAGTVKSDRTEWNFSYLGYPVEAILMSKDNPDFLRQKYLFETIRDHKNILKSYIALKKTLNGTPKRKYVRERMVFFNCIINPRLRRFLPAITKT